MQVKRTNDFSQGFYPIPRDWQRQILHCPEYMQVIGTQD